ncbi:MAG: SpoIIE family protein phosphatase [Thermoleophilia bacterium]
MTPSRHRWSPSAIDAVSLAPGLAIVALLAVADAWAQPAVAVVGFAVVAPLLTALIGGPREVVVVAAAAIALVLLSAAWRGVGEAVYFYRVGLVGASALLAALLARSRAQVGRDRQRFAVLAAVAEIADGTRTLGETVEGLNDIVVPEIADVCIVDAISGGELQRLAVRASTGRESAATQAALLNRPPATVDTGGDVEQPLLMTSVNDELLQQIAVDAEDLARLRAIGALSFVIVPLRARGRRLGSLTLIDTEHSGRRFHDEDLDFAKVLAGRAALALDNAGLFSELETVEAQLTAALSTLAEAVTVQHTGGSLIYANEAAARMLGFASPQELIATPVEELVNRFETAKEDGSPLRIEELPGRQVIAGVQEPEPLVTRTVDRRSGELAWRLTKASGVYGSDGALKLVVNVIEDITEVKRAEFTQRMLARASEVLSSSLDYERTLQQVAELAVPQLADWCAVSMPDGHGFIRSVAVAHIDPDKVAFARRIGDRYPTRADAPTGTAQVMRDGKAQLVNEISEEVLAAVAQDEEHLELLRSVGIHAGLTVPMTTGAKIVGALTLISSESGRRFEEADVALAEELARRAGTAVENARLYTERSNIAHTLQTSLLPGRLPQMPGWTAATLYRPAGDENWVGGDFYDAFAVSGGWLAIVGDVAGRGAAAAALTGLARHTLRTAATLLEDPLAAIGTLNRELLALDAMSLCSVAAVLLSEDGEGRATVHVVCAGHPLPLLVRAGGVRPIGSFSPMLGAYAIDDWQRTEHELEPGDLLVLFTDGVFDTVGAGERFGEERLARTLEGATDPDDAVERIDVALTAFEVGEQADDTAILAVQRVPVAAVARRR